ncbi:Flp pilus assembly complex ATPase component TadA [Comamonas piscis]|uniref:Flp pilus assembly complex ATPase component TadA n=1 Tax=Comamonas piscis TaxID=1562974 RepID=A0A7G5EFQ7_9BURK|nr:ATPase, T2SS/T4P/T4SS family [Comamonas piscis]QMV72832.1 Flp pilus assembly complex ATPase component TadA [Comamonas piscis]WSO35610.1 ATPase, T2SS/T4P/T4SS family [Comamonas piscis]
MHKLLVNSPRQKAQEFELGAETFTIGKSTDRSLHLTGWNVARDHAVVMLHDGEVFIEDRGSLFGTWVNNERVTRYGPCRGGEEVVVGGHSIIVVLDDKLGGQREEAHAPGQTAQPALEHQRPTRKEPRPEDPMLQWRRLLHRQLLEQLEARRIDTIKMKDDELRSNVRALIAEIIRDTPNLPETIDRAELSQQLLDEAIGLGPLEVLLQDDSVTEVMVNRFDEIWIERRGRLERTDVSFTSDLAVNGAIERIVTPLGRRIDESSPMVDARLKDGSRVNAIIPPLAIRGPSITIRKFPKKRMGAEGMVQYQSISQAMVDFLQLAVENKLNIVVSGGTGTGKTTLLNMMSNFIPNDERILTVEDAAELSLNQPNLVSLEARPANVEGKGAVSIRDLVKNSLRMRPDRIVVGECRSGEALDMLQAMNTGHDGSLTTLHANSPRDAAARMEVLVTMAGMNIPVTAIREQIASAIHLMVQLTRFPCGSRKITQITEVLNCTDGVIQMQDIFMFRKTGLDAEFRTQGRFEATGVIPDFVAKLVEHGVPVNMEELFFQGEPV